MYYKISMLMNERDKEALLLAMTFQVSYDGYSHQTNYHGAFSLLDNRLRYASWLYVLLYQHHR